MVSMGRRTRTYPNGQPWRRGKRANNRPTDGTPLHSPAARGPPCSHVPSSDLPSRHFMLHLASMITRWKLIRRICIWFRSVSLEKLFSRMYAILKLLMRSGSGILGKLFLLFFFLFFSFPILAFLWDYRKRCHSIRRNADSKCHVLFSIVNLL